MSYFGIAASTREGSLNCSLFDAIAREIEVRGHQVARQDYAVVENLPLYTAAREATGIPEEVRAMASDILAARGLVIASPEYNFSIPGPLKNAIDWISRIKPWVFIGKPVLLLSASASPVGGWRGLSALRVPLTCLGAQALPWEVTLGGVANQDQVGAMFATPAVAERADTAVSALIDAAG